MGDWSDFIDSIADALWKAQPDAGVTDLYGNGSGAAASPCTVEANAQTKTLDAKISDLSANWRPSGFYSPEQVTQLVNATLDVIQRGLTSLATTAADDTLGDATPLREFTTRLNNKAAAAKPYLDAARAASAQGTAAVNAPGLKQWVVNSMIDASSGMNAAYIVACRRPWWAGLYNLFATALDYLWKLAKAVVGVVVDVGTAVVKVASSLPDIVQLLMWGGAALGAYVIYTEIKRR